MKTFRGLTPQLRRMLRLMKTPGKTRQAAFYDAIHVKGADVASATTITLLDPSCDVTGTTTITGINPAPEGVIRRIRFTGILTFTHNATSLILPTAANITTAANDSAELYSLGDGNWICFKYTLANGTVLGVVPITKGGTGQITAVAGKDALTTQSTSIAGAGTTDLSTATGELVSITSSGATITSFGTVSAGAKRVLTFTGAHTLTHNATSLQLPTEANITTAAGDTAYCLSLGSGNWKVAPYQRANGDVLKKVPLTLGGTNATTAVGAIDNLSTKSSDIASASTVDLSTATGDYVEITGSTSITGFSSQTAGVFRRIKFTGSPLLYHNSTSFILKGRQTMKARAGDIAQVISLGSGNWQFLEYDRADGFPVTQQLVVCARINGGTTAIETNPGAANYVAAFPWHGNGVPIYNTTDNFWYNKKINYDYVTVGLAPNTVASSTTNASTTVTPSGAGAIATFKQLIAGMEVTGTGIPVGATISTIQSDGSSITLSAAATATGTPNLTFTVPAGKNVDVFGVDDGGEELALRLGLLWSSNTARNASNSIATKNGVFYESTPSSLIGITSGTTGTYLGTVRTNTAGFTSGTAQKRFVWNAYHREPLPLSRVETTATWNYSTSSYRQANNSASNQVEFVVGLSIDPVYCQVAVGCGNSTATARLVNVGIGLDRTNGNDATVYNEAHALGSPRAMATATYNDYPGIGYHYLAWVEKGNGTDTQTWVGTGTDSKAGMTGWVMG